MTLNFSVVSNNSITLHLAVLDVNDDPVNATSLAPLAVKWQWFIDGQTLTKSTAAGTMSVLTLNPLVLAIPILSSDTIAAPEGSYAHEAVTVDVSGLPVTVTNNDPRLSWGTGFLRKQKTVQ